MDAANLGAADFGLIFDVDADLSSGFGALDEPVPARHITITADGTQAYLSKWDAGFVLRGLSHGTDPQLISVAIGPVNRSPLDGEVNSHSSSPNEEVEGR